MWLDFCHERGVPLGIIVLTVSKSCVCVCVFARCSASAHCFCAFIRFSIPRLSERCFNSTGCGNGKSVTSGTCLIPCLLV